MIDPWITHAVVGAVTLAGGLSARYWPRALKSVWKIATKSRDDDVRRQIAETRAAAETKIAETAARAEIEVAKIEAHAHEHVAETSGAFQAIGPVFARMEAIEKKYDTVNIENDFLHQTIEAYEAEVQKLSAKVDNLQRLVDECEIGRADDRADCAKRMHEMESRLEDRLTEFRKSFAPRDGDQR